MLWRPEREPRRSPTGPIGVSACPAGGARQRTGREGHAHCRRHIPHRPDRQRGSGRWCWSRRRSWSRRGGGCRGILLYWLLCWLLGRLCRWLCCRFCRRLCCRLSRGLWGWRVWAVRVLDLAALRWRWWRVGRWVVARVVGYYPNNGRPESRRVSALGVFRAVAVQADVPSHAVIYLRQQLDRNVRLRSMGLCRRRKDGQHAKEHDRREHESWPSEAPQEPCPCHYLPPRNCD